MVSLPQAEDGGGTKREQSGACGTSCGAGLEKIYPTTAVRYSAMNWIGEFQYRAGTAFSCGAKVVIQTERGIELGKQVSLTCNGCDKQVTREQINRYIQNSGAEYYRLGSGRILREATPGDISENDHLNSHAKQESDDCALLAAQMELDMKIVTVEHLLGGERVVYYFMAEGRVDFRNLVRELATRHQTRIEMRQVGARDEARLVADYEICGRECCCKNFLKTLRPVKMQMAKIQKATLDLSKVSGRCGRLRCCLRYEHEGYEELAEKLPRVGSRVRTEHGDGTVVDRQILTQLVMLRTDDDKVVTVPVEAVTERNLPMPKPALLEREGEGEDGPPEPRGRGRRDFRRPESGPRRPERPGDRGIERPEAPKEADDSAGSRNPEGPVGERPEGPTDESQNQPPRGAGGDGPARRRRNRRRRRKSGPGDPNAGPPAGPG